MGLRPAARGQMYKLVNLAKMFRVTVHRNCSRPGCQRPAAATLEFNYADQIAIIGPLQPAGNPHRWDLCEDHVERTSVPQGWRLVRKTEDATLPPALGGASAVGAADGHAADDEADEEELLALAEAVQRAYEESGELPKDPGPRLVRREEIPLPTGHHPARGNLPSSRPRRHLRAVQEND